MGLIKTIKEELDTIFQRDPAARSIPEVIFCYPGFHAILFYRLGHWFWVRKLYFLGRFTSHLGRFFTGIEIHPGATIGKRFFIDHGMGVVVGETAEVGDDVTLYQGVTLGGVSLKKEKRHPTIGDNVTVGAGSKVLGPFTVGENAKIGSNSVVVKEVPPNTTVVGIPGRAVGQKKDAVQEALDHDNLPDPVAKAISCVVDRVVELEKEINVLRDRLKDYEDND
ncbi:serine O-acetyltransferase [Limisalsivibrio acetivorans]|uniref:serine O-acetyltransferase n=1 Tax=Limisalsivibrio acetivorans TaxID=1304888 RepID=UPI0003B5983B|nr:serine O-acetyltransferase [Limisalsivibrio acetivorans]